MTSRDPIRDAVFSADGIARARALVADSLKRSGCILHVGMVDALASTVLETEVTVRKRLSGMVSDFADAHAPAEEWKLRRLVTALGLHSVNGRGEPYLPDEPEDDA